MILTDTHTHLYSEEFKKAGIYCIMLKGDKRKTAAVIAKETGVEDYIAECLPSDKV